MRRLIYHGYNEQSEFLIKVVEESPGLARDEQQIVLTRMECNKILKHMLYGKKGEERVIETVNGDVVS